MIRRVMMAYSICLLGGINSIIKEYVKDGILTTKQIITKNRVM